MQVEIIRFRKKYRLHSHLLLRSEEFNGLSPTERKSRQLLSDNVYCNWTGVVFTHGKSLQHMYVPVNTVRMESCYNKCLFDKHRFDSNVLLFTPATYIHCNVQMRKGGY